MSPVRDLVAWYKRRSSRGVGLDLAAIRARVLALGAWLKEQDYIGSDVKVGYLPKEISTVLGFALMGWVNLYQSLNESEYLDNAEACLLRLLSTQTAEGAWLFPYPFRQNPSDFPYACENLMTARALLHYCERIRPEDRVLGSIRRVLEFLCEGIGYEGGVFWYSSRDRIKVPNVSSMAANVFARAHRLLGVERYLQLSRQFADYCLDKQNTEGAYPYFADQEMVYIPYHALELWEMHEANEVFGDPRIDDSTDRALTYLSLYLERRGYRSTNLDGGRHYVYLFKTPLWGARAYMSKGQLASALKHLGQAMAIFQHPGQPFHFYMLRKADLLGCSITYPILGSPFIRYNASCFEIGSRLLQAMGTGAAC